MILSGFSAPFLLRAGLSLHRCESSRRLSQTPEVLFLLFRFQIHLIPVLSSYHRACPWAGCLNLFAGFLCAGACWLGLRVSVHGRLVARAPRGRW